MKKSTKVSTNSFSSNFLEIKKFLFTLQKKIRKDVEYINGVAFKEVKWRHKETGGGKTLQIQEESLRKNNLHNQIFEKAGLNVSAVGGVLPKHMASILKCKAKNFNACGISLVFHPFSPLIPTVHMNVRFFETENGDFWFGGGIDLTPYYPEPKDFIFFHQVLKDTIEKIYPNRYYEFKKKCDEYFFLPHRNEMRGIGGVFFDYQKGNFNQDFALIQEVGNAFIKAYMPLVKKHQHKTFTQKQKEFQLFRRSRYVEFNLLYDRGTLFGLKTGGRIDSILMSLPLYASFKSEPKYSKNSFENKMKRYYQPKQWVK